MIYTAQRCWLRAKASCLNHQDPLAARTDTTPDDLLTRSKENISTTRHIPAPAKIFHWVRVLAGVCHVWFDQWDLETWTYQQWRLRLSYVPCSLWRFHASLAYVPLPHGAVLNIRPQTLNMKPLSPRASTNVLSDALMLPSQCAFTGGCFSAKFMDTLRLLDWTSYGYAYQYLFCLHTPTFVEVLGVSGVAALRCGTAAAGTPQPVSSVTFRATAVEPGHQPVRSRGVAIKHPANDLDYKEWTTSDLRNMCEAVWSLCSLGRSSRAT